MDSAYSTVLGVTISAEEVSAKYDADQIALLGFACPNRECRSPASFVRGFNRRFRGGFVPVRPFFKAWHIEGCDEGTVYVFEPDAPNTSGSIQIGTVSSAKLPSVGVFSPTDLIDDRQDRERANSSRPVVFGGSSDVRSLGFILKQIARFDSSGKASPTMSRELTFEHTDKTYSGKFTDLCREIGSIVSAPTPYVHWGLVLTVKRGTDGVFLNCRNGTFLLKESVMESDFKKQFDNAEDYVQELEQKLVGCYFAAIGYTYEYRNGRTGFTVNDTNVYAVRFLE